MTPRPLFGQPSWILQNNSVQAAVTQTGGHLGPVTFTLGRRKIQPFHIAPWAEEPGKGIPPIIQVLRGDFFCMPFGANTAPWKGKKHPLHGETANAKWTLVESESDAATTRLHLRLKTRIRPAVVDKRIELRAGHRAVYCRHTVTGASGPINIGHHAMVRFPRKEGSGRVSVSPIRFGQVYPEPLENPAQGGYSSLKRGATFRHLGRVPLADGGTTDLTRYPAREGFEDLVMVSSVAKTDFAWSAVVFAEEGYAWFQLKDPRVLVSTVLWHSNGGRHYAPWSGRHRGVLGIEEVTSYFHEGLAESAAHNSVNARGIPTAVTLSPKRPLVVNLILGVAAVPRDFSVIQDIQREEGAIVLIDENGKSVRAEVDPSFLVGK